MNQIDDDKFAGKTMEEWFKLGEEEARARQHVTGYCVCCGEKGTHSISLVVAVDTKRGGPRYFFPDISHRDYEPNTIHEVAFCWPCMRELENNFRATIRRLQTTPNVHSEFYKKGRPPNPE
jgi:hypothetical protein